MLLPLNKLRSILSTKLGGSLAKQVQIVSSRQSSSQQNVKETCLVDFHRARKARMELFAGYTMPIVYANQTIKQEHQQTRSSASAFDVSHMMQIYIQGPDACKFIEGLTVADIQGLAMNKCALSVFTNDTGGILDDCIIGKRSNYYQLVSNAGNAEIIWKWLNHNLNKSKLNVKLDRLVGRGLIALQGPKASEILQKFCPDINLADVEFMTAFDAELSNLGECQITRCGYTGEDGFEISVESKKAIILMENLCNNDIVKPAGLGARDTLRLEAGLCLHGHDITDKTTPIEAALNWTIHKARRQTGNFPGFEIIRDQLKNGSKLKRIGLIATSNGPPSREGCQVTDLDGKNLGLVTSGNFSPSLGKNIAMSYLPSEFAKAIGKDVACVIRGKKFGYQITKMPFVRSNYYSKP